MTLSKTRRPVSLIQTCDEWSGIMAAQRKEQKDGRAKGVYNPSHYVRDYGRNVL